MRKKLATKKSDRVTLPGGGTGGLVSGVGRAEEAKVWVGA